MLVLRAGRFTRIRKQASSFHQGNPCQSFPLDPTLKPKSGNTDGKKEANLPLEYHFAVFRSRSPVFRNDHEIAGKGHPAFDTRQFQRLGVWFGMRGGLIIGIESRTRATQLPRESEGSVFQGFQFRPEFWREIALDRHNFGHALALAALAVQYFSKSFMVRSHIGPFER